MLTAALFTSARTWKQTKCPSTDEWIKMWYIYTMEFYLAIKNNEIMPFAAILVDLEIIILSKSERESQIPQDITNIWNLKYDTGIPWWLSGEKSTCQCQRHEFEPWSRKIPQAMEELSPCAKTIEPVLQSPGGRSTEPTHHSIEAHEPWSPCFATREATTVRNLHTATRVPYTLHTRENEDSCLHAAVKTQHSPK